MQTNLVVVSEYCRNCDIEPSFLDLLAEEGLIDMQLIGGIPYLLESQLPDLERYTRWYYDLSINVAGIDAVRHLLTRMDELRKEIYILHQRLSVFSEYNTEIEDYW